MSVGFVCRQSKALLPRPLLAASCYHENGVSLYCVFKGDNIPG
jgi:hypothetical protein